MDITNKINEIDHIGIPTDNIKETIDFYENLGFKVILRTYNEEAKEDVAFLKLHNYVIETLENGQRSFEDGPYQHIALNAKAVDELYEEMKSAGYIMLHDRVQYLPFWKNGVKFFMIKGPNNERIEFCQKL